MRLSLRSRRLFLSLIHISKVAGRQIAKLSTAAKNDLLNQVAKALVRCV